MKKTLVRLMSLILVILSLSALMLACATPGEGEGSGEGSTNAPESSNVQTDIQTFAPDDLNDEELVAAYGGQKFKIIYWEDVERLEFEVDEMSGSVIPDAILKRNQNVQKRTGVTFEWDHAMGSAHFVNDFYKHVANQATAGNYYDLVATYSRSMSVLMRENYMKDLNNIADSYLNFDKPWWPEVAIDEFTINDKIYFVTGDCSTNSLHFMYVVYYNAEMYNDLYYDEKKPTDYVSDMTWTLDTMLKLATNVGSDITGNGKDIDDDFGIVTIYYHLDALYSGSDMKLLDQTADQTIVLSPDMSSQKIDTFVTKLSSFFHSEDGYVSKTNDYKQPFTEERSLFALDRAYLADPENGSQLNSVKWEYGIVPVPMWDTEQEDYITCMGNPVTLYGIMVGSGLSNEDHYTRNTAVLECWASEAYRNTTPAVFEITMKSQFAANNVYANMYQIAKDNISFDLGRIFSGALEVTLADLPSLAIYNNTKWVGNTQALKFAGKKIEALSKKIDTLN